jgi:Alginate lyase
MFSPVKTVLLTFCLCVLATLASAQIGGSGWVSVTPNFKVQSPYNLPVADRYSISNGVYHFIVYSNDAPFSMGNTTKPRTEQRFEPDYTNAEIQYQSQIMVPTNVSGFCVFQIHTGDAQSPTFGSTTFMLFWFSSDGGSVHDYSGTELAKNLANQWFQLNVDHNVTTRTITVYINSKQVWQQQDNGAGDFYFKDGVYTQNGATLYMEDYIQNIRMWTNNELSLAQWTAVPGAAANTNWSSATNWTPTGVPGIGASVFFDSTTAVSGSPFSAAGNGPGGIVNPGTFNNYVDAGFKGTIGSVTYSNINGSWQNTLLANGATLTLTGGSGLVVGNGVSGTDYGNMVTEFVTIAGAHSTLALNNPGADINVMMGTAAASGSTEMATLDLSGLGTLNANIGQLLVGVPGANRPGGVLYLAATNTITAGYQTSTTETDDTSGNGAIVIGDSSSNNGNNCYLYLGSVNTINADTIITGRQKNSHGRIQFNPNLTGTPTAVFRGVSGSRVQVWSIGDGVANGGTTTCEGVNDFSLGSVDALVSTLYVGRASTGNNAGNANASIGTLTFNNGVFNVDTLYAGLQTVAIAKPGLGIVNVNTNAALGVGGTLIVNSNLILGSTTSSAPGTSGTLTIGGTVQANNIVAGGGASSITLNGGTLILTNTAGTPAAPLTTLSLNSATLQLSLNAASIVTNIVAGSITTSGTTTIKIATLNNVSNLMTFPVLSYAGTSPFSGLNLAPLPVGYTGTLTNDAAHKLISLALTAVPPSGPPVITGVNFQAGQSGLVFTGANGWANGTFYILASTNPALPFASWTRVATNTFNASGTFTITNAISPNTPFRFFLIESP